MRKLSILFIIALIAGCNSQKPKLDLIVKKYMTDSIVPMFNDPSSYKFVSMKVDTFTGKDYCKNLRDLYNDTTLFDKDEIAVKMKEADSLANRKDYLDSIIDIEINVTYRGKNKFNALIFGNTDLRYYPKDNKIKQVEQ